MADKQTTTAAVEPMDVVQRAKGFWEKNSKMIIIIGSVVIIVIGSYFSYKYLYQQPREQKSSELIFPAEKLFDKIASNPIYNKDTVNIVLNGGVLGGTNITGLLKIISSYSGTSSANRAEYIVGACSLQIKEFDKAIKHLKEFDANGAYQIESKAYLLLGHAYAEKKNTDDALSYYKKAASVNDKDEASSSAALYIAGMYAENIGKTKEAIDLFQQLKDNYPNSSVVQSGEADKYLARLGVTK
ncbi:MAG: tetratricopeptide repeat protein [Sphingobacteriales bacterium]|nr:tetratricopeptide repeat protein [Sphingobacteriales bacterium]